MNMNLSELELLSSSIAGLVDSAGLKASVRAQLWTVVVLERTGDAARDPYRTATGFLDQNRALAFAQAVKTNCGSYCVLLYQGVTLSSVVAGDPSLLEVWRARTGMPTGAPELTEVADVTAEATSGDPNAIANGGAFVDANVDTDPNAST